ncbi:MAG: glycan-binding surface protein [Dysgonamonadaceae bacterium]
MKLYKIMSGALFLISLISFTSCQDIVTYNDGYDDGMTSTGAPKITAVYQVGDTAQTTPISEANLKDMLHVRGVNLSGVKKVMLNDVEVPLKTIYAKATDSYFPIPRVIPTETTNKLVYTTEKGETSYDFVVSIPDLKLTGLENEFAFPGDTVRVVGDFFDLYGFTKDGSGTASVEMNGTAIKIDSLTEDYMSVIIPENTPDNSIISFKYIDKSQNNVTVNLPYRQVNTLIWPDLAHPDQYGLWAGTSLIVDGTGTGQPEALYGSYVRVKGSYGAWSWNNLPCGGFNFSNTDAVSNPGNYYFAFEVNSATNFPFYDSLSWGYIFQLNGGNYAWNPSSETSYNTYGKWVTIRIPLTTVATAGMSTGWISFFNILQPNSDWTVEHNFANYRIEKKTF